MELFACFWVHVLWTCVPMRIREVLVMAFGTLTRVFSTSLTIAAAGGAALLGYQYLRAGAAADIYRDRLVEMTKAYEGLARTYNQAIEKTAVTELVVKGAKLSVRVVSDAGVLREIKTPYDPAGEIYVDYVVADGRLWIRRVFDSKTPPRKGIVIDPALATVAWTKPGSPRATGDNASKNTGAALAGATVGKAVYRALGEGRWVVSVTGSGALGLVRVEDSAAVKLSPSPDVREYAAVTAKADEDVESLGVAEVLSQLVGGS